MSAILKFDFQRRKQLHFSEENYLNYTKRHSFACDTYIFPKTSGNKNKQSIHPCPTGVQKQDSKKQTNKQTKTGGGRLLVRYDEKGTG